jgi:hypothetical protein
LQFDTVINVDFDGALVEESEINVGNPTSLHIGRLKSEDRVLKTALRA